MKNKLIILFVITSFNVSISKIQVPGILRFNTVDKGIVLRPDLTGGATYTVDGGGVREAIINKVNDTYYMFYDGAGPNGGLWRACLGKSPDLVHWTKLGAMLNPGREEHPSSSNVEYKDWTSATSPWVYNDNGQWYMYYLGSDTENNGIPGFGYNTLLAKSSSISGPWTKTNSETGKSNYVSFVTKPGTWLNLTTSPGHVMQNPKWTGVGDGINKKYIMFLSGSGNGDGTVRRSIGIARTNDLNTADAYNATNPNFWSIDANPIVPATEDIENSSIYYEPTNGYYFLFTNHIFNNAFTNAIWVYWTKDIDHWNVNDKAVVVDINNNSWAKGAIGMPTVVAKDSSILALVFDGCVGTSSSHLNREIGLVYLSLPLQIPTSLGSIANDDNKNITYTGSWTDDNVMSGAYNDDTHYSNVKNNYAEFAFTGTEVSWIGEKVWNRGMADVYIDNVLDTTIDCYHASIIRQQILYRNTKLINSTHKIKIVVKGQKNNASSENYIDIDAIRYLSGVDTLTSNVTKTINNPIENFSISSNKIHISLNFDNSNDFIEANIFNLYGRKVKAILNKNFSGNYEVSLPKMNSGVYILNININRKNSTSQKFIIN